MTKRPSLQEAFSFISNLAPYNKDCQEAIDTYHDLTLKGQQFLGARLLVEIVTDYNSKTAVANCG